MTAYAIDFRADSVTVAADTLAYIPVAGGPARPLGSMTKVLTMPHLCAGMLTRGMMLIGLEAHYKALQRVDVADVEDMVEVLAGYLVAATDDYADSVGLPENWEAVGVFEAVFFGWSRRDRRMKMWALECGDRYTPKEDGGGHYGRITYPNIGEHVHVEKSATRTAFFIEAMQAFRRVFAETGAGVLGGDVQEWRFDKDGLAQRVIWRFPDAARLHADGADRTRRIMSGEETHDIAAALTPTADLVDLGDTAPAETAGLSRPQRRRLKAMGRL